MHPRHLGFDLQGHGSAVPDEAFSNGPIDEARWALIDELVDAAARC